ncbi:MAG: hypothetical protein M0Q99_07700 [Candidatus Cloacimonetes bacterium]|nr:hypothetical protein [Candidatus Cloacimonadota bacterium]
MCEIKLDQQFVVNIGKSLEPYFSLVENRLLSTSQNQFECSIKEIAKKSFQQKLDDHFKGELNKGGIYLFHIITSDSIDTNQFVSAWNATREKIEGKRPKANINRKGQRTDESAQQPGKYALYVGSSLKVGSRIKEHFRDCKTAKSTTSLRLRCFPSKCLKNIVKITVNYITFDGLHDSNSKEVAIHNLCRYFESKLRQKYQALIGE